MMQKLAACLPFNKNHDDVDIGSNIVRAEHLVDMELQERLLEG